MRLDKRTIRTLTHDYFDRGIQLPAHGTWNSSELRKSDVDDLLHFYNNSFRRGLIEYPEKTPHPKPYSTNRLNLKFFFTNYLKVLCQRRTTVRQLETLFQSLSLLGIIFPTYDAIHSDFYYCFDGKSFNHNMRKYAEFILILKQYLSLEQVNVCEIGAGYGGMTELLLLNGEIKNYFIIDLFETMAVSMTYLMNQLGDEYNLFYVESIVDLQQLEEKNNIVFIPVQSYRKIKKELPTLSDIRLFINTSSFVEMASDTVSDYLAFIEEWKNTYLFSYNKKNRIENGTKASAYALPFDNLWKDIFVREDNRYDEVARLNYRGDR